MKFSEISVSTALCIVGVILFAQLLAVSAAEQENGFRRVSAKFDVREVQDSPTSVLFSPASGSFDDGSPSPNSPNSFSPLGGGRTAGGIIGFIVACLMFIICVLAMIPFCLRFFFIFIRNKLGLNKN